MKPRSRYKKTKYVPTNIKKYVGSFPIICRSSWETKMAKYLDLNPNVLAWASEPFAIPYKMPDGSIHNYYPDYYIKMKVSTGEIKELVVEVKPSRETKKPRNNREKKVSTKLYESQMYIKNQQKWAYAKEYCKPRKYEFVILTERDIFPAKRKVKSRKQGRRRK